jgi:anti-sigma regulatory factor (Ser/Thr protein kinase)
MADPRKPSDLAEPSGSPSETSSGDVVEGPGGLTDPLATEPVEHGCPQLESCLVATPGVLAGLRQAIAEWLMRLGAPEEERLDIVLAASEAAGNAIEHAYGSQSATFTVDCRFSAGEVRVTVRDTGIWRDSTGHGRGRGLVLMRALMDSVEVDQTADGTIVTLIKRVGAPSRSPQASV